jgi:hypothetical protein
MRAAAIAVMVLIRLGTPALAQLPENAERRSWGKGWECTSGFVERARRCVAIARATDSEVRQLIVRESLAAYSANCPCPYNTDRAGRSCGRRSAYSRPGGYAPLCYESDVAASMVLRFRSQCPPT